VLFSTRKADRSRLEKEIAAHLEKALGYDVDTFVRTLDEVVEIANRRVFDDAEDPGVTVHIGFLQQPLPAEIARRLAGIRTAVDQFAVVGTEYYWRCRIRTSESKVWSLPEMRALRLPTSSMRNRSSLRKLISQHAASLADK
jgi:uncharacterized protein (DUF1697 family)